MTGQGDKPRQGRGGFTLLELLTATAMFAVLIGAIYSAFSGAMRLRQTAHDTIETQRPRHLILKRMARDLAGAVTPSGVLAGAMTGTQKQSAGVREDSLTFHTATGALGESEPWGDIQKIAYSLEEPEESAGLTSMAAAEAGRDLTRSVTRNLLASVQEDPKQERLLTGVQSLTFRYYDGQNWQDSWDSSTQEAPLPAAVRIVIEFASNAGDAGARVARPLELVVPILTQAVTGSEDSQEASQ